ncbi:MAG: tRNA (adenine(22)-N(1))-methyltransferase [Anaerotignaceae bacterium]
MEISMRLKTVAAQVEFETVADIGTDHGYVPIYLLKTGAIKKAIACDVNKGPLMKATENIGKNILSNFIETRLGNGLEPIKENEVETAVIAGMGGMLICDILNNPVSKTLKQLVVQPQLDIDKVRKHLHNMGFYIKNEEMLIEDGKFYTVINALKGEEKYSTEEEYFFGKVNLGKKSQILKEYLEFRIKKLKEVESNLKESNTENSIKKIKEISAELDLCQRGLKYYEV